MGFSTDMNHGFKIELDNGYVVSVQFGSMNYCANRNNFGCENNMQVTCPNAEIAVWHNSEPTKWATGTIVSAMGLRADNMDDQGVVLGYASSDTVAQIMGYVSSLVAPNA